VSEPFSDQYFIYAKHCAAFLGNHFLQVLGDNFSCHAVTNPDMASERRLLSQLAPELSEDLILRLVAAFQDLRREYNAGTLTYPYSLRGKYRPQ
jgi:hypothetical protein